MSTPPVPEGARQLAVYYYPYHTIHVFALKRRIFLRDSLGNYPLMAEGGPGVTGTRMPHPDEGHEFADFSYETLGLYYGYEMPDTGWSGDC